MLRRCAPRNFFAVGPTQTCRFPLVPFGAFGMVPRLFGARHLLREPISVTEEKDQVHFELELPRFRPEDVKFRIDKDLGVVEIYGQRRDPSGALQDEFERSFSVSPRWLDLAGCRTKMEHGVATLTIPKRSRSSSKATQEKSPADESKAAGASDASKDASSAQEPKSGSETSAAATTGDAPATTTDDKVARVDAQSYDAVRSMSWPPQFDKEDTEKEIVHTCELPAAVGPDNVEVTLERDHLSVGIRCDQDTEQKDEQGHVFFRSRRSVHYATALRVPRGTREEDVSVQLKDGKLRIAVAKREAASQGSGNIKVSTA
jgi:HSP20 family molecular chaperone IbpA